METKDELCVRLKQRAVIEFLVAECCKPMQIYSRLRNVYGAKTIDVSNVRRWVAAAKNVNRGLFPILDKMRSGRPKTAVNDVNIRRVDELIRSNRRITQDEIAAHLGISHERVNHIINKELKYRKICARWVPQMLTDDMKKKRVELCKNFEIIPHPPYSPDLAPSDFHLFPKMKEDLKGHHFTSDDEVQEFVDRWLRGKGEEFFANGFEKWILRLQKCIELNGDYVEK